MMLTVAEELDLLRAENAYLREQVAALSGVAESAMLRDVFRLPPTGAALLMLLVKRAEMVTMKGTIYRAVFQYENGDGPDPKIIDVVVCGLRRRLKGLGASGAIHTVWGQGYRADSDLADWVTGRLQPHRALAA